MTICEEVPKLMIVYASQQGNAKAIAEDLLEECSNRDISATLACISEIGKNPTILQAQNCAIFIAATTGDGDPPDTARKWWRSVHHRSDTAKPTFSVTPLSAAVQHSVTTASSNTNSKQSKSCSTLITELPPTDNDENVVEPVESEEVPLENSIDTTKTEVLSQLEKGPGLLPATSELTLTEAAITERKSVAAKNCAIDLSALTYTVLGLGDTNYTNFCNFGKNLDEKLKGLGAKRFYPCGWADDGIGLELVIEPWLEGLWGTLSKHLHSLHASVSDAARTEGCTPRLNMLSDTLTLTECINSGDCTKTDCEDNRAISNEGEFSSSGDNNTTDKSGNSNIEGGSDSSNLPDIVLTTLDERNETVDIGKGSLVVEVNSASNENKGKFDVSVELPAVVTNMTDISSQAKTILTAINSEEDSSENLTCKIGQLSLHDDGPKPNDPCEIDHAWRENHILLQLGLPLDAKLTIPKIPTFNSINLEYLDAVHEMTDTNDCSYQNGSALPSAASPAFDCDIVEWRMLSNLQLGREVKKAIEVVLHLPKDCQTTFQPGDTVGVLARNSHADVAQMFGLLGVANPKQRCRLTKTPSAKKAMPAHLPELASLQEIFTSCVDFRCLPKKTMLLHLLDCVTDPYEKRCLQELVSREGSEMYRTKVLETRLTFFDLLTVFTSCQPRVSALLEVLPRLLPRPYSLTSSPLLNSKIISFAFNLTVIPKSPHIMQERRGVCTGALDNLYEHQLQNPTAPPSRMSLYLRTCMGFTLPDDPSKPIIFVGPGTGVAPFVGFLRHRQLQLDTGCLTLDQLGTSWLFFGCRYSGADELYKDELESFVENGTLTYLRKCFSREQGTPDSREKISSSSPSSHNSLGNNPCSTVGTLNVTSGTDGSSNVSKSIFSTADVDSTSSSTVSNHPVSPSSVVRSRYVQHLVVAEATALGVALAEQDARVLVCGDAVHMAKDVQAAFVQVMTQQLGDAVLAASFIAQMQKDKKYLQDVWT